MSVVHRNYVQYFKWIIGWILKCKFSFKLVDKELSLMVTRNFSVLDPKQSKLSWSRFFCCSTSRYYKVHYIQTLYMPSCEPHWKIIQILSTKFPQSVFLHQIVISLQVHKIFLSLTTVVNIVDCMLRGGMHNQISYGDCNVCMGLYLCGITTNILYTVRLRFLCLASI